MSEPARAASRPRRTRPHAFGPAPSALPRLEANCVPGDRCLVEGLEQPSLSGRPDVQTDRSASKTCHTLRGASAPTHGRRAATGYRLERGTGAAPPPGVWPPETRVRARGSHSTQPFPAVPPSAPYVRAAIGQPRTLDVRVHRAQSCKPVRAGLIRFRRGGECRAGYPIVPCPKGEGEAGTPKADPAPCASRLVQRLLPAGSACRYLTAPSFGHPSNEGCLPCAAATSTLAAPSQRGLSVRDRLPG